MLVLLNARAGYGRAASRWAAVERALVERVGPLEVCEIGSPDTVCARVREAAARGERAFVAAGGDGTVNLVAGAIMALGEPSSVTLGAVGLGSSNDFHKPFNSDSLIAGVPVRVDCGNARASDVIRADLADDEGRTSTRFAVINASIGITAEANAAFNEPSALVRAARKLSVNAAIVASVIETIATYRDVECRLTIDGADVGSLLVSSLGIIKNPHFAGSFCYDTPVEPDDGKLGINLCERLTRFQVLATLAALSRKRFSGRPKTRTWIGERLLVEGGRGFALETDGEVTRARRAEFTVIPRVLRCCR